MGTSQMLNGDRRRIEERSRDSGQSEAYAVSLKKMTNKELKEYLNTFPDDAPVSFILANPRKRKLYENTNTFGITDQGQPVFCIEVGEEKDMDAEMVAACEADEKAADNLEGQMDITDFPEVMP